MATRGNYQDLFDELLSTALDVLRLGAKERNKVFAKLAKLERELIAEMSTVDLSRARKAELNRVLRNAGKTISNYYSEIADLTEAGAIAYYVAEETRDALQIYFGIEALKFPRQAYFDAVKSDVLIQGAPSAAWWQAQDADTRFKFAAQLRQGMIAGETNQEIIARIVGKNGVPGVMDTVRRNAASLVQTSVQTVANDARRQTFFANDDVVKGIRQVSTLDSHTSPVCMAYSGAEWNLKFEPINGTTLPYKGGTPRHFSCRSVEVPITATFKELGLDIPEPKGTTRASDEGPVSADMSFDRFLKGKSKAYLDEKLGPGRADLFRAGKITLRDLVNGDGNPVSLEALQELARKRRGG